MRVIVPNDPKVNLFIPVSLIMHDGNMYVTDRYNHKVWVMSTSGEVITTFGDGILREPEGITMDKAGFVYVTSAKKDIVVF
jgi:DNA-binding beta-propeller fold protein YncE